MQRANTAFRLIALTSIVVLAATLGSSRTITLTAAQSKQDGCDFASQRPAHFGHMPADCVLKRVLPIYPTMGREVHVAGVVVVKILIDRKGRVTSACVVSGHPLLRSAAIVAVRQWQFKPNFCFSTRPKKRYVETTVTFRFDTDHSVTAPPN